MKLSPEAVDLLLTCCELGRWHVAEQTICPIAELLSREFVTASGDYDTISIFITDKGRKYAVRQGWLTPFLEGTYEPWQRTPSGSEAANFITDRP
jgi:hypothetical protein